jgi:type IV secretion system protein VirB10
MNIRLRTVWTRTLIALLGCAALAQAREQQTAAQPPQGQQAQTQKFVVASRTRIPLVLVNSVSTKTSSVGDQVYLQTSFPISADGRIVIPEGSYVTGTITQVKRPGKVKGRGEIYLRFDTLMLRNGVKRDFRGTVTATDGGENNSEKEGTIVGDSSKGKDAATIAGPAVSGTIIGTGIGGAVSGRPGGMGMGAGIGAGIGATAGMIGVLLTRGPDVRLLRGTSLEMQLDRDLSFFADEINFTGTQAIMPLPTAPAATQAPISDSTLGRGIGVIPGLPW